MIVDISNRDIDELSFALEETSEEESVAAKCVTNINASHNRISCVRGVGEVFQHLVSLDLSYNRLGERNLDNDYPTVASLRGRSGSNRIPFQGVELVEWMRALPQTLRELNVSHNSLSHVVTLSSRIGGSSGGSTTAASRRDASGRVGGYAERERVLSSQRQRLSHSILLSFCAVCPQLEVLDLSHNKIGSPSPGEDRIDTPHELEKEEMIGIEWLSEMQSSTEESVGERSHLHALFKTARLRKLDLSFNPDLCRIMPLICGLTSLESLSVEGCDVRDIAVLAPLSSAVSDTSRSSDRGAVHMQFPVLRMLTLSETPLASIIQHDMPRYALCEAMALLLVTELQSRGQRAASGVFPDDSVSAEASFLGSILPSASVGASTQDDRERSTSSSDSAETRQRRVMQRWWAALVQATPPLPFSRRMDGDVDSSSLISDAMNESYEIMFGRRRATESSKDAKGTREGAATSTKHHWNQKKMTLRYLAYVALITQVVPQVERLDGEDAPHLCALFHSVVSAARATMLMAASEESAPVSQVDARRDTNTKQTTSVDDASGSLAEKDKTHPAVRQREDRPAVTNAPVRNIALPPPVRLRVVDDVEDDDDDDEGRRYSSDEHYGSTEDSPDSKAQRVGRGKSSTTSVNSSTSNTASRTDKTVSFLLPGDESTMSSIPKLNESQSTDTENQREAEGGLRRSAPLPEPLVPPTIAKNGPAQRHGSTAQRNESSDESEGEEGSRRLQLRYAPVGRYTRQEEKPEPLQQLPSQERSTEPVTAATTDEVTTPPTRAEGSESSLELLRSAIAEKEKLLFSSYERHGVLQSQNAALEKQLAADRKYVSLQRKEIRQLQQRKTTLQERVFSKKRKVAKQYHDIEHAATALEKMSAAWGRQEELRRLEAEEKEVVRRERKLWQRLALCGAEDAWRNGGADSRLRSSERGFDRSSSGGSVPPLKHNDEPKEKSPDYTTFGRKTRSDILREQSILERSREWDMKHPYSFSPTKFRTSNFLVSADPSTTSVHASVEDCSATLEGPPNTHPLRDADTGYSRHVPKLSYTPSTASTSSSCRAFMEQHGQESPHHVERTESLPPAVQVPPRNAGSVQEAELYFQRLREQSHGRPAMTSHPRHVDPVAQSTSERLGRSNSVAEDPVRGDATKTTRELLEKFFWTRVQVDQNVRNADLSEDNERSGSPSVSHHAVNVEWERGHEAAQYNEHSSEDDEAPVSEQEPIAAPRSRYPQGSQNAPIGGSTTTSAPSLIDTTHLSLDASDVYNAITKAASQFM